MAEEQKKWEYEVAGNKLVLSFETVKKYLTQGNGKVTDQELTYFISHCVHQKLDPFIKECYLIKYGDNDPAAIVTAYYVLMARAQEDPGYDGYESGVIVQGEAEELKYINGTVFNPDQQKLIGGWCKVYHKNRKQPSFKSVNLKTYVKKTREGKVTRFWSEENQPDQIEKVAIAQAHRRACPRQLQGMYLAEEVATEPAALMDGVIDVEAATAKTVDNLKTKAAASKKKPASEPSPAPFDREGWHDRTGEVLKEYGITTYQWLLYINDQFGVADSERLTPEQCQQLEVVLIENPQTVIDTISKLQAAKPAGQGTLPGGEV